MKITMRRNSEPQGRREIVSRRILILLTAVTAVVFGTFALVGFSMPYEENANFNEPLLTDVLLSYVYVLILASVAVMGVSVFHSIKTGSGRSGMTNGLPVARITYGTVAFVACTLAVTYLLGSSEPISINGEKYTSAVWLRLTDMFINTSVLLISAALLLVFFGLSGLGRKLFHGNKRP